MALSANGNWTLKGGSDSGLKFPLQVKSGSVIYNTALVSFETLNNAAIPFDGGSTDVLAGWHFGDSVTGDGTNLRNARINTGPFIAERLTVGGSPNNDATDLGRIVYASDDGTYTISATGAKVGRILAYYGSGVFDVAMQNVLGRFGTTTGGA